MATIRVKSAFILRRDTAANWSEKNPILRNGEEGYETDTGKRKVGDGTTEWNNLKYDSGIVDQIYDPDSTNAQSGKAVAEAVSTEQNRADNTFANALKGTKSDTAMLLDDVSPVTHDMGVKVKSKNLLNYEYFELTQTKNGISFTNNGDGTVMASGTATATMIYYLADNIELLGYYTLSGCPSGGSTTTYLMGFGGSNFADIGSGVTRAFKDAGKANIFIKIFEGVTVENLVFKPQLELGTTSTSYTPYVPDLTAVKVKKSNAFGEIVAEYTPSADGTVEGVTSLYPNTTLMTDTDGVLIDCEYNKDINKFSGADLGVPTKTSELINDSNFATQDYVDAEIANFDFIKIVTELPETGLVNRTYFVPKQDPATNDLYDEYMWVDGKWELITTKQIEVDLTNYYNKAEVDNAIAGIEAGGGHWETVYEGVWNQNKEIHIVGYDEATGYYETQENDLTDFEIGEGIPCMCVPEDTLSNANQNLGNDQRCPYTFTKIDETHINIPDVTPLSTTDYTKFHIETVGAPKFININARKLRFIQFGKSRTHLSRRVLLSLEDAYALNLTFYNSWDHYWMLSGFQATEFEYIDTLGKIVLSHTESIVAILNSTKLTYNTSYTSRPLSSAIGITVRNEKIDSFYEKDDGFALTHSIANGNYIRLERWVE